MPPRIAVLAAGLLFVPFGFSAAAPSLPSPAACALELSARDAGGHAVLQTVAYALDRPGLVLASLSAAARLRARWTNLEAAPDPALSGPDDSGRPIEVTEVLFQDPDRDLMILRAPGLAACGTESETAQGVPSDRGDDAGQARVAGEPLIGIRDRDGYRPRVFRASLEKTIGTGAGPDLLKIHIPDGGGAANGFLFDEGHHLVGSILPPPPGGDRLFACAVTIDRRAIEQAASGTGRPVSDALAAPVAGDFFRTPAGLLSQALLLTRDDQADQALRLLDEVARVAGESDVLLLERGARLYRVGRTDRAITDFTKAATINPNLHLARFDLGVALGSAGRYEEAIEAFTRAAEIDPGHAQTRYQLALALQAARQPDQAREQCALLERIDPALAGDLRSVIGF